MATEILRPNAAGDETNLTPENGGANYTEVDESTPDGDVTSVYPDSSGWLRDLYNLNDQAAGSGTINKITVYCEIRGANITTHYAKIAIKSGTGFGSPDTISEGSQIYLPSNANYNTYSHDWNTNPATGAAWTWDEIDRLQAGLSMYDAGIARPACTQVYVEIDYTDVTAKISQDTGAGSEAKTGDSPSACFSKADSGGGAEGSPEPAANLAGDESGSAADAISSLLGKLAGDWGYSAEAGYVAVLVGVKNSADTGSAVEASDLRAALEVHESGTGISGILARGLILSDLGAGIDLGSIDDAIFRALNAIDSGAGIENLSGILAIAFTGEAARGQDKLAVKIMSAPGAGDIRLATPRGKTGIPSKGVNR